jgi:hypothetical protein
MVISFTTSKPNPDQHHEVIVFGSATSRTGHEIWLEGYDMHGPRSARRRRSRLGFGQIAPTGASAGRPGGLCLRYPAMMTAE